MARPSSEFVMSTELECLTVFKGRQSAAVMSQFFEIMRTLAPTLAGPYGIFNGYGRIYVDCGHVEFAACECDSPYLLAQVVECQQRLAAKAVARLQEQGLTLLLANNNHSGLLKGDCPIWGAHENYLTERHPSEFGDLILPFLVTRIFGGAGGIEYPAGNFLAAVRPLRMELATGGGTTECRAIHSLAREEHHMGRTRDRFRYHLILGDGHRSHFNLSLQFGATALAIKAVLFDKQLGPALEAIGAFPPQDGWVPVLRRLNILAQPGAPLAVDPLIIRTQRVYHDAAARYAHQLEKSGRLPDWVGESLDDWDHTLTALADGNHNWLAERLDAFAKYEFYSAILDEQRMTWNDLPGRDALFHELALLDHSYHEFCNPKSVFDRLDEAGMLNHRVRDLLEPGSEPEPFVPATNTRARARARFIAANAGTSGLIVDWSHIDDLTGHRSRRIDDPFAKDFDDWVSAPEEAMRARMRSRRSSELLDDVMQSF